MRKLIKSKKFLYILLPVLAFSLIAGVPIGDDKTLLEKLIAAFPSGKVDKEQQEKSRKSLDDIREELQKISEHNGGDSAMISGKIRLFDNLDDAGIREQQNFILKQAGDNQWFHLDSFDRIQYDQTLFLIDHPEKEIIIQLPGVTDSLLNTIKMMDPQKFKEMLIMDGITAEINKTGAQKTLTISPGTMDAVNRYDLVYDTATYVIKKFRIYYTSVPYQDYLENYTNPRKPESVLTKPETQEEIADTAGNDGIEANITEYMLEFEIEKSEKKCDMNFRDNIFYRINDAGEVLFTGKLGKYKKTVF